MNQPTLRLMTYNIRHAEGSDGVVSTARIADIVRGANVDMVALQEVDRFWLRSGSEDQPRELARLLEMEARFGANVREGPEEASKNPREYGVACFSRFPIIHCENLLLPISCGWEPRGFLEVHINVTALGDIAVINTHLQSNHRDDEKEAVRQRLSQAAAIKDHVQGLGIPAVVLGDFNALPESEEVAVLTGAGSPLLDVGALAGLGSDATFLGDADNSTPGRIDYILATRHFSVTSAAVHDTKITRIASDHLPVTATLILAGA